MCKTIFAYVIFILIAKCIVKTQKDEGDLCVLSSTGRSGKCVLLQNCQAAIDAIQKHQIFPQNCGFRGTQPIVCCEDDGSANVTTTGTVEVNTISIRPKQSKPNSTVGEKSTQKCKEYAKYVYEKIVPVTLIADSEGYMKNRCNKIPQRLIVGGEPAKPREFPHMALIGYDNVPEDTVWGCGGTLISELFVLTAAHCLYSREYGNAKLVRLGDLNINSEDDDARPQNFNIVERIAHPKYDPPIRYNDIALLKLDKPANLNPYARPACLHVNNAIKPSTATATGWGKTDYYGEGSNDLLKVTLQLFNEKQCNDSYKAQINRRLPNGILQTIQLCAGSSTESKDTCQGDSGGPLQIDNAVEYCMHDIIGVTSFGKACGIINSPGVYTRVSNYIEWIENTVWP